MYYVALCSVSRANTACAAARSAIDTIDRVRDDLTRANVINGELPPSPRGPRPVELIADSRRNLLLVWVSLVAATAYPALHRPEAESDQSGHPTRGSIAALAGRSRHADQSLVGALIFLSLMFVALLWMVSVLAKIPLWIPGSITAFIVLTVLIVFLIRAYRAQRAAKGLEDALAAQAKHQATHVRPDLQIEVQQMQEEFDKAVSALKRAGSGRRDAPLLPALVRIIGPPGTGKSTALRNSGLNFPYSSKGGGAAVKVSAARNGPGG